MEAKQLVKIKFLDETRYKKRIFFTTFRRRHLYLVSFANDEGFD